MGWRFVTLAGVVAVAAACGDRVSGTTHTSPPLPSADDAGLPGVSSTVGSGSSGGGGGSEAPDAGGTPVPPSSVTCAGKTGAAGDLTLTLTSGGYARDSLLHVPASYDPTKGTMLVVNYHGYTSNAAEQVTLTDMNPVADDRNFIVAYPDGIGGGWNAGTCCTETQPTNVDDVQFTKDLLALIGSEYCIDPSRIYATGFSNGGFMSHLLACVMADTFAAVAPVSGVLGIDPSACTPSRPVPVQDFHGTADPVVPYDGGPALKLLPPVVFRSVPSTMDIWRSNDACLGAPVTTYQNGTATCTRWSDCGGGADVELCTLTGEGHQWPGGLAVPGLGNSTTDVYATTRMIDFFVEHPMPSAH
ncbi:MAG: extracellular catalytic domain type 1 short-chain-length polyhydroxyalkanoate depolymerase [Polyangiaceae bacterium]